MSQPIYLCPICGQKMHKHDKINGRQRWRCVKSEKRGSCGKGRFTEDAKPNGRPPKHGKPMTAAERKREQRMRDRERKNQSND